MNEGALRLVAVTDALRGGVNELARRAAAVVGGGATMITLRLPDDAPRVLADAARAVRAAVPGVPLLVSDRVDVALAVGADGVHVGNDGLPAAAVRRIAADRLLIGASLGSLEEVSRAAGADFVAIGPVFTASRGSASDGRAAMGTERFGELVRACRLPAVAIGGVTPSNIHELLTAGASGVAVISSLFGADDPSRAARALRDALDANGR